MKRLAMVLAALVLTAGIALAHGEAVRVIGTVTAISSNSITVQTVDNKSSKVDVSVQTKFVKSGVAASIRDLKVGDRVVIDAGKVGEKLDAHQVRFGTTSQPASAQQSIPPRTLIGIVSDAMCGATHTMANMSAADCTRMCAKGQYVLVVGKDIYTLKGHEADLSKLAGASATVKGAVNGKTVTVQSVIPTPKAA